MEVMVETEEMSRGSAFAYLVRQPGLYVAAGLWILVSFGVLALCHGNMPLPIGPHPDAPKPLVISSSITLVFFILEIGLVSLLARKRPWVDLAERAPGRSTALRETLWLWVYGIAILLLGRFVGLHFFGEGIALHLNGSLVGATRVQPPAEVITWSAFNGVLLAFVPYVAFRMRGYTNRQLNLRSLNLKSDVLIIFVVLAIGCIMEVGLGKNFIGLTHHQQVAGGLSSFALHMFGTDLPIMIFIYAILMPRYFRLVSSTTAYLLAAASYPAMHVFESWTRYDSAAHGLLSVFVVFLILFPAGLVKSFLTLRTGNAWVHLWGFHAVSPHVTVDTRLIVQDFKIR
jgi:hypothetical protein